MRSSRKSIGIYILNGAVTVKAPFKTDIKIIESFLAQKSKWIERKLNDANRRSAEFSDIYAFEEFLYFGQRLKGTPSDCKRISIASGELMIPDKCFSEGKLVANAEFLRLLKHFYRKEAKKYLAERIARISDLTGLKFADLTLTNAKTKWGSCDTQNRIKLNWRLLLLGKTISDYVIVHELAHTVHHNHSNEFWQCVARLYPQYKEAKKCLKDVGVLTGFLR